MKIIAIGGTGTIGSAAVRLLEDRHDVIVASRRGPVSCDIESEESIRALFEKVGKVDAVLSFAGEGVFAPLEKMDASKYAVGLQSKLMGQVNTVLIGTEYLNDGGSFTLTTGCLAHKAIPGCSSSMMVNNAIEGFVRSASIELPRGIRINAVSPTLIAEAGEKILSMFPMLEAIPAAEAAKAYAEVVEGRETGQVVRVGY